METRSIGKLDASVVGLGCNNFGGRIDEAATKRVVDAALDAGITLFDTADIYGGTRSEEFLGRALGSRRDEAVVATKFGGPIDEERKGGASAAYIARAVEDSLRRLGTDRIDLYQLHFPDASTPFDETLEALDALVRAGQGARDRRQQLLGRPDRRDDADQRRPRLRAVRQRAERVQPAAPRSGALRRARRVRARNGLAFIPYFPLASGVLTGKYHRDEAPPAGTRLAGMPAERRRRRALRQGVRPRRGARARFARDHGHTLRELAIAWLLAASDRRQRDRRRDQARAGAGRTPRGRGLDAHRRRPPRDRRPPRRPSQPERRETRSTSRCWSEHPGFEAGGDGRAELLTAFEVARRRGRRRRPPAASRASSARPATMRSTLRTAPSPSVLAFTNSA